MSTSRPPSRPVPARPPTRAAAPAARSRRAAGPVAAPAAGSRPAPGRAAPARGARVDAAAGLGTPSIRRSEAAVHEALTKALLGGSLRPGTALRERQLAETFGTTRGAVRKVLARLGQEGKLELRPNRGAFVPEPGIDDVRRVYEHRRVLECGLCAVLAGRVARERLAPLEDVVSRERRAQRDGRRDEAVRLAGDFHLVLVDLLDNPELSAALRGLVARTRVFVALFETADAGACSAEEHETIVRALRRGDAAAAVDAMSGHLAHVEGRVLSRMPKPKTDDVAAVLRAALE